MFLLRQRRAGCSRAACRTYRLAANLPVGHVAQQDEDAEQEERDEGLHEGDLVGGPEEEADDHPDVSEDGEEGGDEEDVEDFDFLDLLVRDLLKKRVVGGGQGAESAHAHTGTEGVGGRTYRNDADAGNHEQVEGSRPDDGGRAELARNLAGNEVVHRLDDGQQDFRGGRAEGHKGQVGHGGVPDGDVDADLGLRLLVDLRGGRRQRGGEAK